MITGDLNCDVSKIPMDIHALSLHQLDQLIIDKPTRVTEASSTVIDLVLPNVKENRPFPSSCLPPLQSESKFEGFVMKISFHSYVK